jgi:hypothetical protein
VPFAEMLLDQGARIDIRDELLRARHWVGLAVGACPFCEASIGRGADPVETDAEPWATPGPGHKR